MKVPAWVLVYGVLVASTCAGFFFGIEGAKNIALLEIWAIMTPLSFVMMFGPSSNEPTVIDRTRATIVWLAIGFVCMIFVWFSYFYTATALLLFMFANFVSRSKAMEGVAKNAD